MSRENVEVVRAVFEAFARRDADALLTHWHPNAEWRPAWGPGGIEGTTYVGHDGMRQWLAEVAESWETFEVVEAIFESVGRQVVVLARVSSTGRASGVQTGAPLAQVFEIVEGKVHAATAYLSHEDALEAVGLRK